MELVLAHLYSSVDVGHHEGLGPPRKKVLDRCLRVPYAILDPIDRARKFVYLFMKRKSGLVTRRSVQATDRYSLIDQPNVPPTTRPRTRSVCWARASVAVGPPPSLPQTIMFRKLRVCTNRSRAWLWVRRE